MSEQITTVSIFKSDTRWGNIKGFFAVAEGYVRLRNIPGQNFFKVMGVGKSNFDPKPDWSTYMHVQVWNREKDALAFFESNAFHEKMKSHADQYKLIFLRNSKARGLWAGKNPFEKSEELDAENDWIFVITRARIKLKFLKKFWDYVPTSQKGLYEDPDLVFTAGVGEWPVTHMATMSLWKSEEGIKRFAYKGREHRQAIQQTQALQWYSEELFSRFQPYKMEGDWSALPTPEDFR